MLTMGEKLARSLILMLFIVSEQLFASTTWRNQEFVVLAGSKYVLNYIHPMVLISRV